MKFSEIEYTDDVDCTEYVIDIQKPQWRVWVGSFNVDVMVAPNRFHRFMQRVLLGWTYTEING